MVVGDPGQAGVLPITIHINRPEPESVITQNQNVVETAAMEKTNKLK